MALRKLPYKRLQHLIGVYLSTNESSPTQKVIDELSSSKKRGYLTKTELVKVCRWKSARAIKHNWYRYLMILRYFAKMYKVGVRDIERTLFEVHRFYQKGTLYHTQLTLALHRTAKDYDVRSIHLECNVEAQVGMTY